MARRRESGVARVYIRTTPFEVEKEQIFPQSRQAEILACSSEKVRLEKYYVWKLLEVAISDYLGIDITEVNFEKIGRKWVCDKCYFSLSHSNNVVAVGISKYPIGVDIQIKHDIRDISSKIISCPEEKGDMLELWSMKEAIFKASNQEDFVPANINTIGEDVCCETLMIDGNEYILSVASRNRAYKQIRWDI